MSSSNLPTPPPPSETAMQSENQRPMTPNELEAHGYPRDYHEQKRRRFALPPLADSQEAMEGIGPDGEIRAPSSPRPFAEIAEANGRALDQMEAPTPESVSLEELAATYNTVGAFYHDAYSEWQVVADTTRCVFEDCRWEGWGEGLGEAIRSLKRKPESPDV